MKTFKKLIIVLLMFAAYVYGQPPNLLISTGNNNHAASYEDPDGADVVMVQFSLLATAGQGDATVTSITVDPVSGNNMKRGQIVDTEIRVYHDVNNNGVFDSGVDVFIASANYSENSNQNIAAPVAVSIPNKTILDGTSQNWIILHTFSGGVDAANISVSVTGGALTSGNVTGSASGNTKTIEDNAATQNGALFVGQGGANPLSRNISNAASNEVMIQLILSASTLENATVSQINFAMSGTADEDTDLSNAKLYIDGDANGVLNLEEDTEIATVSGATLTDNGTLSFGSLAEVITAGSFEHWIVVYNLNGSAADLTTFALSANSVTATGITVTGAPVSSNTATVSATGSLTLSLGSNNPSGSSVSPSESDLPMIQLNLAANATEDIAISSIIFKTSGSADESADIDSVVLVLDGNGNGTYDPLYDTQLGSTVNTLSNNGTITFSVSETITAGSSENWLLLYYLNGNGTPGTTFNTYFDVTTQVTADGVDSFGSISPLGLPVTGNNMTISDVGTLTLAVAGSNPGDANFNGVATNLSMLAFTMSANDVEDINIISLTVSASTNNMVKNDIDANDIKIYQDVDENGLLNVAVDRAITSANYGGTGQVLGDAVISISGETISANSSVQWLIVHTISASSVGDYIEVSILNSSVSGTGASSGSPANISGPSLFGGIKTHVTGVPGSLTLNEGAQNPVYRFISAGAQNEVMLQFQLSADAIEDIDITQISIITSGTGDESTDLTSVRLFLDGDDDGLYNALNDTQLGSTVSSMTNNDTLTFSGFTETITSSSAKNFIVVYNFNAANNAVGETFKVITGNAFITATGFTSATTIVPTGGPAIGEIVTITDTGTITVSAGANNPGATNVGNSDNDVVTIQLKIAAGSNEDVTITSIRFTMTGTFDDATDFEANTFRLYADDNGNGALDGGESQLGTGQSPSGNNGTVTFSGLSQTILAATNVNWIVLCNLNGAASNFENFRVSFANSANMSATGVDTGDPIFPAGAPVQGGLFTVGATGSLSLTTGSNNPAAGNESNSATSVEMLQLRLSASGVENINITNITFTASGTGNDQSALANNTTRLFRDVNNDGILDGGDTQLGASGNYSGNDGTITFAPAATVTASTSQNWLVVYDFNGTATNGQTFRTGILNASQIVSVGVTSGNPIVETGFPVVGNYKTINAIGNVSIAAGPNNPAVANIDSPTEYEMIQIQITTSSYEAVEVDEIMFTHQGTGNLSFIAGNGVQLVRDVNNNGIFDLGTDDILAATNYSGTTATFTLSTPETIAANTTEYWLIMYDFINLVIGQTYQTRFVNLTNISLTGVLSGLPITAGGSVPISGGTMTVDNDFGLPVELTSFVAAADFGAINLQWQTASEINNLGFQIERKLAGTQAYEFVASYQGSPELSGQGTTSSETQYVYRDSTVIPEQEYTYRLVQYDYGGAVHILELLATASAKLPLPTNFVMAQNYPNPFNPNTTIKYGLPQQAEVNLSIYNILGQRVITLSSETLDAGFYTAQWDGRNNLGVSVASGTYFYVLKIKSLKTNKQHSIFKKMILLR